MKKAVLLSLLFLTYHILQAQKLYQAVGPNGKTGFLDKNGEVIVDYIFDQVFPFHHGRAKVRIGEHYGFIDKTGKIIIPVEYESLSEYYKGVSRAFKNGQLGFLDEQGNLKYGWYNYIGNIEDNLALISRNGKYAYINDLTGKPITDFYDYIEAFDKEGIARVGKDGEYFLINRKGKTIKKLEMPGS